MIREYKAEEFIIDEEIYSSIEEGEKLAQDKEYVKNLLERSRDFKGLTHREAAVLLAVEDEELVQEMFKVAGEIKERIYGNRIVLFAPLYLSNHCVNNCEYCGYQHCNSDLLRKKLTQNQIAKEVQALEAMGHKRLALELGEDPINNPIEYVLESLKTIYSLKFDNGAIRRCNVNIAATTVEEYEMLKDAGIGTYILFQETYHKPTYENLHPNGPKHNYNWHTTAMHRARAAGIDDVGMGVLYGLYEHKYDTIALLMHAEHLDKETGVGPHTLSVPRLRPAEGVDTNKYPHMLKDEEFKKLVAILRITVPYTGIILSTREEANFREEVLSVGVSQVSAGSCTGVGGYADENKIKENTAQFEVSDERSPSEVMRSLCNQGYVPSYCTACYREGRTGERFMALAKSGQIHNVCLPNALLTFKEYLIDYADEETKEVGEKAILKNLETIPNEAAKEACLKKLERIENGERDLRF
ncbi:MULTISPECIES: [FeFe] hydrogenase H-cluster radical SAM maturase HydG [Clostridium]|uniref:[FeFe] hydrogenase H-cluster radical SAM maturase HydG n=1 Tax=Clostridium intestinale TaxID=36845 RepID=A0A7D6ZY59_9CLOT|nr:MULTISPECIES: [FeFe] hydrogenase H-cluster radical SAM maturase HydG [Clostridium]QLY80182.1 [FeFe] hydrogenase H-cluster radical SAM maturase HydG [Clostridium intestinale]